MSNGDFERVTRDDCDCAKKLPRVTCENCAKELSPGGFVDITNDPAIEAVVDEHTRAHFVDIWSDDGKDPHVVVATPIMGPDLQKLKEILDGAGENGATVIWTHCLRPTNARLLAKLLLAFADEATRIEAGKSHERETVHCLELATLENFKRTTVAS